MKLLLVRSLSWGWGLLVAIVVVSAIIVSVARIAAPFAKEYRGEVAAQLSRMLKRPVAIDGIDLGWHGFSPNFTLSGVQIKDDMGLESLLRFREVRVRLDLWRSLRNWQIEPNLVALIGSDLSISRTRDGRILVRGLQHLQRGTVAAINPLELLAGLSVRLQDINVQWQDAPLGRDFAFTATQAELQVQPRRLAFETTIRLPQHLGNTARVVLLADGPIENYLAWHTRFHIDGDNLELAGWPLHWLEGVPGVRGGRLDLRLWGQRSPARGFETLGDFTLRDFEIGPAGDFDQRRVFPQITSRVAFNGGAPRWRLDLDQLWVVAGGRAWPASGLSVEYVAETDRATLALAADWVDVGTLSEVAQLAERLPPPWREHLAAMRVGGDLSWLRLELSRADADQPWTSRYSGVVDHLRWDPSGAIPGVSGITVDFHKDEEVRALVSSATVTVIAPRMRESPLALRSLVAELSWRVTADAWTLSVDRVRAEHADFQATGAALLHQGHAAAVPELTLELQVPSLAWTQVRDHLPYPLLPPRTGTWLREAFRDGRVDDAQLRWDGPLSGAALKSGEARMSATFNVEAGVLHYRNDWPDLTALAGTVRFDNARMRAEVRQGRVFASEIGASTIEIPDLFQAVIGIDTRSRGPLADVTRFLKESPLGARLGGFLDTVEVAGDSALALVLRIPSRFGETEYPTVNGRLEFLSNRLNLAKVGVDATETKGVLEFTERSYRAQGVRSMLRGSPVTIAVETNADAVVGIDVDGRFALKALLPARRLALEKLTFGESDWHARVEIPRKGSATLRLTSDLHGTGLRLPEPLGKSSFNRRDFSLRFPVTDGPLNYRLEYADLLSSRGRVLLQDTLELQRISIGLGMPAADPPPNGVAVQGRWAGIDLGEWLGGLVAAGENEREGGVEMAYPVRLDDVLFDVIRLGDQRFNAVRVDAQGTAQGWQVTLRSPEIAGEISLPARWRDGLPLRARIERLHWRRPAATGQATVTARGDAPAPHQVPALDIQIDELLWGEHSYERGILRTVHSDQGQTIERLELHSQHLSAVVSGDWQARGGDGQLTILDVAVDGRNVGAILHELIGTESLGSGVGTLKGQLRWPGAPHQPVLSALEGQLRTKLRDGRLLGVEPGLGRLIALLSVDHLPKRLAFNFRDVAADGFAYDVLEGAATFSGGQGYIEDLGISGSAAQLNLSGRMRLVEQDFDGRVIVRPRLSSTLPVAASFLAGPEVGVAVYLFDKLIQQSGFELGSGAELHYEISGGWENPRIRPISSEPAEVD
ncbi:MAG: YhdP family protein [Thiotrichales bacterium]